MPNSIPKSEKTFYLSSVVKLDQENTDLPTKFEGVAYSGSAVDGGVLIDLATTQIAESLPLLFQHEHDEVIGFISSVSNDGATLKVSGVLFSDIDETAAGIAKKAFRGATYQMSIGIFDFDFETISKGTTKINNRDFEAPVSVLRNGVVREVSIVSLGADRFTNASFFSAIKKEGNNNMTDTVKIDSVETKAVLPDNKVLELSAKLDEWKTRAIAAESALSNERAATRKSAVLSLFKSLGRQITDSQEKMYISLSQEVFEQLSSDLLSIAKRPLPLNLMQEQAIGDTVPKETGLDTASIYSVRRGGK